MTVEILNLSEGEVRVDRLVAGMAGPATRSVVRVDPVSSERRAFERPAADTYAVFHQGRTPGCRGG